MKTLLAALTAACALGAAGSASAAIVFGTGSLGGLTQVHSTGSQSGTTVFGALQGGGPQVSVYSSDGLDVNGSGYAQFNGPFTGVEFFYTSFNGGFTAANFGLTAPGVTGGGRDGGTPAYLDVFAYDLDGNALTVMIETAPNVLVPLSKYSMSNNLNTLNVIATNGEILSRLGFAAYSTTGANPTPRLLGDIRQIDLNAVPAPTSAVPEPATWAMMIVGFGLMGGALRRRRDALAAA